ncbi:M9 family metallopeptidase [Kitasatospora sp. NPDC059571]|uniref:M9 family metallopeptidase n=1 Tax=Kitasatospora sp. NPDC059571 TaxID=3346871 RepID=UPI003695D8FC
MHYVRISTRHLTRWLTLAVACCLALSLFSAHGRAAAATGPAAPRPTAPRTAAATAPQPATGAELPVRAGTSDPSVRAPHTPVHPARPVAARTATARAAAATCTPGDFTGRTGSALVQQIKAVGTDCVNTLFALTGTDAYGAFREAQMTTVANALRDTAATYPGDDSTSAAQLVLYLRAGYYVQWYHSADTGPYGAALQSAIRAALDGFFAAPHSRDVTDANGQTLAEAVTLIDSAGENARYLGVVQRLLSGYTSAYNASWWMVTAVNNTYTVLWRGHQSPDFVAAVRADHSVLDTLSAFAVNNDGLLGGDQGYLTSNAGRELARFLQYPDLQPAVRPLVQNLLGRSAMTGRTAQLWMGLAEMADQYDAARCADYGTCDLPGKVRSTVLTTTSTCSPSIRILAQQMTADQLAATCTSLTGQDAYVHGIVRDGGPVAGDRNTTIEVVVFHSSADYQTYAGVAYGIDTNNGGIYLEGDPSAAGNQPRFVAYEAEWLRPAFQIWNLNHEYTHYLDGRFDMYGDFAAGQSTPTVWWVEGFAEYVSYSYRGADYTDARTQAGRHTYALSTLFDTTYDNADQTRIYNWGYLAVRYMLQSHRSDMDAVLAKYRTGDWNGARSYLTGTVGTRYDADFANWLTACSTGDCGSLPAPDECTAQDTRRLDNACRRSNLAATTGNYAYLYLWVPAGTARLTVTSSGGTGNADLYYSGTGWATTTSYTARSAAAGNTESLTVANPHAGWNYVSLYAAQGFTGAAVSTSF